MRTVRGPRQRIVTTIGKLPGLDREERIGWDEIGRILLSCKARSESGLFHQADEPPSWAKVNITDVTVERLRHFGDVYLGLLLWSRLSLADFCREKILPGREDILWSIMAAILVLARFRAPSSELQIAASWYDKSALDDLLGVPCDKINDDPASIGRLMSCCPTRMSCAAICRNVTENYLARPSTFCSTTSPSLASRGALMSNCINKYTPSTTR